jgi:hypothetical protein
VLASAGSFAGECSQQWAWSTGLLRALIYHPPSAVASIRHDLPAKWLQVTVVPPSSLSGSGNEGTRHFLRGKRLFRSILAKEIRLSLDVMLEVLCLPGAFSSLGVPLHTQKPPGDGSIVMYEGNAFLLVSRPQTLRFRGLAPTSSSLRHAHPAHLDPHIAARLPLVTSPRNAAGRPSPPQLTLVSITAPGASIGVPRLLGVLGPSLTANNRVIGGWSHAWRGVRRRERDFQGT